jgi:hypothetical protein
MKHGSAKALRRASDDTIKKNPYKQKIPPPRGKYGQIVPRMSRPLGAA